MRICIIGKYPPIQGGVSMRTYWTAHALAARGHDVHVVTNAKEVCPPFRMHMRAADWARCEGRFGTGLVTVHWTDPVDRSQSYIPMASPFVSKLAAAAANAHAVRPFDVIYSHYMEPYGVAAYLASQMTSVPHVARMAGSDAGRLWHHPQLEALYDHVLRSAEMVVAAGAVAERAVARGVEARRVAFGGGYGLPDDLFTPEGPVLDLDGLRAEVEIAPDMRDQLWGELAGRRPYFGIYGKLGDNKGSFALLAALHRLKAAGLDVGLVALAHGRPEIEQKFRERARRLGLSDRVLQIPFVPHWRVPEFLRGCLAVCCLEHDFPIRFHAPMTPREVLLCGACLVGSTEVIRKIPGYEQLPHGYGCIAIDDVRDTDALAAQLAAIVKDPEPAAVVGARGRAFALELQSNEDFPQTLECILEGASTRRPVAKPAEVAETKEESGDFPLARIAATEIGHSKKGGRSPGSQVPPGQPIDLAAARALLAAIEKRVAAGETGLQSLARAVELEIAIAGAKGESDGTTVAVGTDPLFRLRIRRWAMSEDDLAGLVPVRDAQLSVLSFDFDVSEFRGVQTAADFPAVATSRPSYIAAFRESGWPRRHPLLIDGFTARILELSDGTRTARDIVRRLEDGARRSVAENNLKWIENLFLRGLIWLRDADLPA